MNNDTFEFMKEAARKSKANIIRKRNRQDQLASIELEDIEARADDDYKVVLEQYDDVERDPRECPFCHTPDALNVYNACSLCHTIIGKAHATRHNFTVDESELIDAEDLNLKLDVQKALDTLTEQERLIVNAVVHKVETLEDIAIRQDVTMRTLWRVYAKAKAKLSIQLVEYAFNKSE